MFERSLIARANMNVARMAAAAHADEMVHEESVSNPIAHQIGHAARALGERLVALGERLDRHEQCVDGTSISSTGLAQP